MNEGHYKVTLVESDEGFAVWCDDLAGCCSQGSTREEAPENIRDAIREYLAVRPEVLRLSNEARVVRLIDEIECERAPVRLTGLIVICF